MWRNLIAGIQFLTIIPCGPTQPLNSRKALPLFPICGLIVGGVLTLIDMGAAKVWSRTTVAVIDVVTLAIITGALHLDGLGDTADGLYGRRPRDKALAIMKDSRIGAIGMVVVTCCLALKWAGISEINRFRPYWLLLVPAFARTTILLGIQWLPYGRPDGGTGHSFFQNVPRLADYWAVLLLLTLTALLTKWGIAIITVGFTALVAFIMFYYWRKIKCITGDMLGAMIESVETGLFLLLAAFY